MRSRRRVVLAGTVVVELAESGRVGGRAVLALHGREGAASMAATVDHLGVEHQVLAPTHPGWTGTQPAASPDAVAALARAYLEVLAADGAHDVVVVGVGLGAWVGARMALADTEGRIGAVVLIAPPGLPPGRGAAGRLRGAARCGRARSAAPGGALGACAGPAAVDPALAAALGAVVVPALVVRGGEDPVLGPAGAIAWAHALGAGRLAVIAGGGHLPCHLAPGATFAAIDAFLSPPLILSA